MSTTVCVNGVVQFTFFLVMRLNITIVTSFDSLNVTEAVAQTCSVKKVL